MRTLLIIPAFNEAGAITSVVTSVRAFFAGDVLVIDDGSEDETGALARAAGAMVVRHACNLGIGAAVQTGFIYGLRHDYDFVVRQDGDGQHDPAQIPRLLAVLEAGEADIVIGSRFLAREGYQSTLVRRIGIFILGIVSSLVGARVTDPTSGNWAVNQRALLVLAKQHPDDYPETEALVMASRAGCRVAEVPVVMYARIAGQSSISTLYSGFYMFKVVLALLVGRLRPR